MKADPVLLGLSIADFAEIINAVWRHGEDDKPGYVWTGTGKSKAFKHDPLGIPLRFEAKKDSYQRGYNLRLYLYGNDNAKSRWEISCVTSPYPPGNTDRSAGHWSGAIWDEVTLDYLGSCGYHGYDRYLFGFTLEGDIDAYRKDMAMLRLAVEGWREEE